MPIDPRLNCAAEICCPPPEAFRTQVTLLIEAGVAEDAAPAVASKLAAMGVSFAPTDLMQAIAAMADHPGRSGR